MTDKLICNFNNKKERKSVFLHATIFYVYVSLTQTQNVLSVKPGSSMPMIQDVG